MCAENNEPAHGRAVAVVQRHRLGDAAAQLSPLGDTWRHLLRFPHGKDFGIVVVLPGRPSMITFASADELSAVIRKASEHTRDDVENVRVVWVRFVDSTIDEGIIEPLLVLLHEVEGRA